MRDPILEWFPALTGRRSQTTLQGWEWISGQKFNLALSSYQELNKCFQLDPACVIGQANKLEIPFDHLYVKKQGSSSAGFFYTRGLVSELEKSPDYKVIFENDSVIVFDRIE